ncbi:IS66 family insertion sequence element accessory protein TnpB [Pseudomonas sp. NFACC07-1]|uniref:IS66 family insertion sequence element accessory protein TnpB n=1 Tax=Pseudomonas sp. NFACC07-1 TaxID=1566239 RepID=UPI0008AE8F12|nr:IS66 family insertion sequence element accessory protein TnpB [Pseudomonas sp. NFACC07-1]SEJ84293.1 IS66 Orf2 like protein [Pseudomonas sp. NFACC07-1]
MADYSELTQPECSWSVESADLAVMRYRVQTIEPQGLHQFKISATQYEPQKYAAIDAGARIDPQPTSVVPPGVMTPPTNITLESRRLASQSIAVSTMRITWDAVPGPVAYNVEWRKDSDGPAALVELDIKVAFFEPVLFVFLNKPRNRVKILHWERNGAAYGSSGWSPSDSKHRPMSPTRQLS